MSPLKKNKNPPERPNKVSVLQENIRLVAKEVRTAVKTGKPGPSSSSSKKVQPAQATGEPAEKQEPPWENPYARELFFCKTNVREIAREEIELMKKYTTEPEKKNAAKVFRYKLFRAYVEMPRKRIMSPLHKLRFVSPYYEYRCHLALAKGLHSEEAYQDYKALLNAAGVRECWVDMGWNNLWITHQNRVVKKVRKVCVKWSAKLEKLNHYVMDLQRKYEERQAMERESAVPELLDALLNRSNAPEMMSQEQIKFIYHSVFAYQPSTASCFRALGWLQFHEDELNRKYQLGRYLQPPPEITGSETDNETIVGITPLDRSVCSESVRSDGSEIEQMRSEMAMTQPNEMILTTAAGDGKFYQNTEEVITVLEPTQPQQQVVEALAVQSVPTVDPLDVAMDVEEQQQQQEIINLQDQEDEPMPQQQQIPEPVVAERQSGEEGSDFSLLTPGQQEVILIADDSSNPSSYEEPASNSIKEEVDFWTNLDNVRKFTNINAFIESSLRTAAKGKMLEKKLAKLDMYVEKYFREHLATFRERKFPTGIIKLSRKERLQRERVAPQSVPKPVAKETVVAVPVSAPAPQTPPVTATPEPLFGDALAPFIDTPRPMPLPTAVRRINYEDSPPPAMESQPNTESFLPEICSTQLNSFGGPMIGAARHPGTPRPSPQRPVLPQRPSVDSRASTPAFAADTLNETVLNKSPRPRSRSSPRVKTERMDCSGYEDEVVEIPINKDPILLDDTLSASQTDPNELIEKVMAKTVGAVGCPPMIQKRMEGLFQKQNIDDTVQISQSSDGSGGGRPLVSQDRQSMGFHSSHSPSVSSN